MTTASANLVEIEKKKRIRDKIGRFEFRPYREKRAIYGQRLRGAPVAIHAAEGFTSCRRKN